MGGSGKKKRAKRAAQAAAAAQQAELTRIKTETEAMQRGMGEELAAKRKARQRTGSILLGAPRAGMGGEPTETLG